MGNFQLIVFVIVIGLSSCSNGTMQCSPWLTVEKRLKEISDTANCTTSKNCDEIKCELEKLGYEVQSSIHINSCEAPPYIELNISIPKMDALSWNRKFYHGDHFTLTGGISGNFDLQKEKNNLVLGLTLQAKSNSTSPIFRLLRDFVPIEHTVFHNVAFPLPECSKFALDAPGSSAKPDSGSAHLPKPPLVISPKVSKGGAIDQGCSIDNVTCPEHEMCMQLHPGSTEGVCQCMPGYKRNEDHLCVYDSTTSTTTASPTTDDPAHHLDPKEYSKTVLWVAIAVPVLVLSVVASVIFLSLKFRICQRMRRRLRVQIYEQVLLLEWDEEDTLEADDNTLNPVV